MMNQNETNIQTELRKSTINKIIDTIDGLKSINLSNEEDKNKINNATLILNAVLKLVD